jgi:hypothetical protein
MHPSFVIRVLFSAFWTERIQASTPQGERGRESLRSHPRTSRETQGYVIFIFTLKKKKRVARACVPTTYIKGETEEMLFFL